MTHTRTKKIDIFDVDSWETEDDLGPPDPNLYFEDPDGDAPWQPLSAVVDAAQPAPLAPGSPRPKPARKPRINWRLAAQGLARGRSPADIAREMRVDEPRIWRNLHRSPRFRRWIEEERALLQRTTQLQFQALRHNLVTSLRHKVDTGNVDTMLWMAKRLGLGPEPAEVAPAPPPKSPVPGKED